MTWAKAVVIQMSFLEDKMNVGGEADKELHGSQCNGSFLNGSLRTL